MQHVWETDSLIHEVYLSCPNLSRTYEKPQGEGLDAEQAR